MPRLKALTNLSLSIGDGPIREGEIFVLPDGAEASTLTGQGLAELTVGDVVEVLVDRSPEPPPLPRSNKGRL